MILVWYRGLHGLLCGLVLVAAVAAAQNESAGEQEQDATHQIEDRSSPGMAASLRRAEQGDAGAQYVLGIIYEHGMDVPQDDAEAVKWYRKAAEQGHAGAQLQLGSMYDLGRGVSQDDFEAAKWYRVAAEQDSAAAQRRLGRMYAKGRGVLQDDAEAVEWYRRAAEQGNAWAQYDLGLSYDLGRGVPQDDVQAYAWLNIAAAHISSSVFAVEVVVKVRDRIAREMTYEARDRAQKLAREYWEAYVLPFRE